MELSVYITSLLHQHDCVVVPNFGGFIANYRSAVIDEQLNRILPPSKEILFNPNLLKNDGLLSNEIANKKALSYNDALEFIRESVEEWKADLNKGNRVEVGEIGFLFMQDGKITFEQNREVNLLMSAYGLSSVKFLSFEEKKTPEIAPKAIEEVIPESVEKVVPIEPKQEILTARKVVEKAQRPTVKLEQPVADEQVKEKTDKKRKTGFLKYAVAAATIPVLFYAYWIPMKTDFMDTGKIQLADFNPIKSAPARKYQMRIDAFEPNPIQTNASWEDLTEHLSENVSVYNYHFDDELYIPIRLDKSASTKSQDIALKKDLNYHVIAGCFSVESNAHQLVDDLTKKGYAASIFDKKGGLYRVSAGDFAHNEEANDALDQFRNKGFSGWILKK